MVWTEERIEDLKRLVAAGGSAAEIAAALHLSRNAVIGKVARLGLVLKGARANKTMRKRPAERQAPAVKQQAPPTVPAKAPEQLDLVEWIASAPAPVEYLKLTKDQCRALLDGRGNDGLPLSCGRSTEAGVSYCAAHARIFYAQPIDRR